ncbi:hypothetical protein ACIRPH_31220 [Nocardiopsis sp. NPDC101807]|uniref:hypothetical protein n=1 Tax=Nocardiopsis sp. NPDC101807 TaxID=3364339 RepID=UPI00382ACE5A
MTKPNAEDFIDWDSIRALGPAEALKVLAQLADLKNNPFAAERARIVGQAVEEEARRHKPGAQARAAKTLDMKPARLGQLYHEYKEKHMTYTNPDGYVAAVATASDVVAGEYTDVTVAEREVIAMDVDDDGNEIPILGMSDRLVMGPIETTAKVGADMGDIEAAAEAILEANGWRRTGPWEVADNALYAAVERA